MNDQVNGRGGSVTMNGVLLSSYLVSVIRSLHNGKEARNSSPTSPGEGSRWNPSAVPDGDAVTPLEEIGGH